MIINRKYVSTFIAGGMLLELKGTCSIEDLKDAEAILELAIKQILREYAAHETTRRAWPCPKCALRDNSACDHKYHTEAGSTQPGDAPQKDGK